MNERVTPTPEFANVGRDCGPIDHTHPSAVAFAVLGDVVGFAPRNTHTAIFNALKAVAAPQLASPIVQRLLDESGPHAVYADFGVSFYPELPSLEDLAKFAKIPNELNARRSATLAGRAWSGVVVGGRNVTVLSWWVPRRLVPSTTFSRLVNALDLTGEGLLEFEDSRSPESRILKPKHG